MRRQLFRSGNPALSKKTFENLSADDAGVMTLEGTVNKTAFSLLILFLSACFTFSMPIETTSPFIWGGFIGGLIVAIITIFKKEWAPYTVPLYAVLEGLALGGISAIYDSMFTGIAQTAIFLTFGIFMALLLAYKSGLIKATENFKLGIVAATGGIMIFYVISMILSFFSVNVAILNPLNGGLMSIGFSFFVVIIASLNLVLDFDFIENGADVGAPKYMEWYGAFGLLVTLVWLYLEILRLLSKLYSRD